jgi:hypothetical protein
MDKTQRRAVLCVGFTHASTALAYKQGVVPG